MRTNPLLQSIFILIGFIGLSFLLYTLTRPKPEASIITPEISVSAPQETDLVTLTIALKSTSQLRSLELTDESDTLLHWEKTSENPLPSTLEWKVKKPRSADLYITADWDAPSEALEITITLSTGGKTKTFSQTFWSDEGHLDDILELKSLLK